MLRIVLLALEARANQRGLFHFTTWGTCENRYGLAGSCPAVWPVVEHVFVLSEPVALWIAYSA